MTIPTELISKSQYAYTKGRSVETALHSLVGFIEELLSQKEYSLLVFLNIEGALFTGSCTVDSLVHQTNINITVCLQLVQNLETYSYNSNYNSSLRTEEYINLNRQQHVKNIEDYDTQMEIFKQSYASSLDTIKVQQDMLVDVQVQTDDKLNPLEILSDLSKKCVSKYRSSIPTVAATKSAINSCVTTASNQLNSMLSSNLNTRNYLDSYYKNNFEKDIDTCQRTYSSLQLNYTICITNVVTTTNSYTITNQKSFATQMDAAQCSATANIKKALDCSFTVQNKTISSIAEANTLINKCLVGQDDCKQCNQLNTCSEVYYLKRSEVDYNSRTMANPFYGRNDIKDCLKLQIY
ncbi:uncharacterized protein LOC135951858 [Calliphora vicina]|uniref:uncharacterized protein LOC135951858 n=1 Tax=Calliphora vicina TaxID=7373 RepID=UPI00325A5ADA